MSNPRIRISGLRAVHAFYIPSELSHLNGFDARQGVLSRTRKMVKCEQCWKGMYEDTRLEKGEEKHEQCNQLNSNYVREVEKRRG